MFGLNQSEKSISSITGQKTRIWKHISKIQKVCIKSLDSSIKGLKNTQYLIKAKEHVYILYILYLILWSFFLGSHCPLKLERDLLAVLLQADGGNDDNWLISKQHQVTDQETVIYRVSYVFSQSMLNRVIIII